MVQIRRIIPIERLSLSYQKGWRWRNKVCLFHLIIIVILVTLLSQLFLYNFLKRKEASLGTLKMENKWSQMDISRTPNNKSDLKSWHKSNLLDVKNFSWIRNNESLCKPANPTKLPEEGGGGSSKLKLLPVLIFTARQNFRDRLSIRRSWGSISLYNNWDIRLVFLMGEAHPSQNRSLVEMEEEVDKMIAEEDSKYGDIVLGSFVDSYRNLTYKHLMGYKWILNFCPEATRVLKSDDDLFVDVMQWVDWIDKDVIMEERQEGNKSMPDIYCNLILGALPSRVVGWKWFVTREEWPAETFPTYCNGWTYVINLSLIRKLYEVSNNLRFFWIDDVFVTGALMEEVKRKYGENGMEWQPEIVDTTYKVRYTIDFFKFYDMCEERAWEKERNFGYVVFVGRNYKYSDDWRMCLWNKTLYDYKKKII